MFAEQERGEEEGDFIGSTLYRRIANLFLDTVSTINLPPLWKMTSRSFTEGRFLVPPDSRPPPDSKKKDPLRPISRSKSAQVTKPSKSPNPEPTKRVTFLRPEQSIRRSKLNKAGKSTKLKKLKKSTKGKKPKSQEQPEQPKPPEQQQHVPKPLPPSQPDPFRRETILQLRQNPPSLSAPTVNKAHVKHQIVLPRIKPKKVKRRMATIYDVIARMNPLLYHPWTPSNIDRSCRS